MSYAPLAELFREYKTPQYLGVHFTSLNAKRARTENDFSYTPMRSTYKFHSNQLVRVSLLDEIKHHKYILI